MSHSAMTDTVKSDETFNVEKYLRQYSEGSSSLVDSPVHLERLKFLIQTLVSEYNAESKMEDLRRERDTLILLFKTLEQKLVQIGNMKMYWELFQTHYPSDETSSQKKTNPLYYKDEPLPHCLGLEFNEELYQHTLMSQSNKATTLKANLSTAQHLISKEAIRNAHLHLAQFYTQTGSYDEAISHLKRVKEYSNPGAQLMEVTLLMAELGLAMGNYSFVQSLYETNLSYNNHHHLMSTSVSNMEQHEILFRYKWNIARGIAFMAQGYYKEAYKSFMSMSPSNDYHTNDIYFLVHIKDIAMYTGLMALMVLNRKDMEDCMSKTAFKSRFDSMIGIKDAMMHYSRANYGDCMNALSTMYSSMTHDLFLKNQVNDLWKKLKGKCLVQYLQPYISVRLDTVRDLFVFQSTEEVEDVVSDLIESGELINVKIDGLNQTLVGVSPKDLERRKKRNMMKRIATLGDSVLEDVENVVTRLTCMEYGIVVPANRRGGLKGTMSGTNTSGNMGMLGRRRDWAVAMRNKDDDDFRINGDDDDEDEDPYEEGGTGSKDASSDDRDLYFDVDPEERY